MLQGEIDTRNTFPGRSIEETFKVASQVKNFFSDQTKQRQPYIDKMLITDIAIKGWIIATATQGYLLLEVDEINKAERLLEQEVTELRDIVHKWVNFLLDDDHNQISTAYRFTASIFTEKGIEREQVDRIAYISEVDRNLSLDDIEEKIEDVEIEFSMITAPKKFTDKNWIKTQTAVAEYLDTWSELLARLESLQDFANFCKIKDAKSSLDILPDNNAEPGLYLKFPN